MSCLRVFLDRISKLKKNFNSCEAGRYFLEKTWPMWDSLTQCIYKKSYLQTLFNMYEKPIDKNMPEQYRKLYEQVINITPKRSQGIQYVDISFLEILITGS